MSEENGKKLDPRDINDLYRTFEKADFIVRKRYREDLDEYQVCDLPEWLSKAIGEKSDVKNHWGENVQFVKNHWGENVQFVKINKLIYDENENVLDKLTNVYHAMSSFKNTSIIMVLHSDGVDAEIYLGIAERKVDGCIVKYERGKKLATLETAFNANFPGSETSRDINDEKNKIKLINEIFDNSNAVSVVTGIASQRKNEIYENKKFVQGIEKLIDAMHGKKYSAVFIADCKGISEIEKIRASYENIYSELSPFAQSQQTIGKSDGISETKSFIKGVTNTINESVSDTVSHSHSLGKSKSNTIGFSGSIGIGNNGIGANYNHTTGKHEADTDTNGETKTKGEAKSETEQNSVANTNMSSLNDGIQINFQNRAVKTLMERIDEQIKHLRYCEAYGVYDFGCYFISSDYDVSETAASIYNSLMHGEESSNEVASVNTWNDENAKKAVEYLKRFYHPLVAVNLPRSTNPENEADQCETIEITPGTLVSGKEISIHMGLPKKSVQGIPVTNCSEFGRNVVSLDEDYKPDLSIGKIYHMHKVDESTDVKISTKDLTAHTFITGSTGVGKSNAIYQLISKAVEKDVKFMVIEPAKGEYKDVFGNNNSIKAKVYGTNPKVTPLLRINPFSFPKTTHIYEHMDRLVEIFNVCWPMYAAMPAVLKAAIEKAYISTGWDLKKSENKTGFDIYPTFASVAREVKKYIDSSEYSDENKGNYKGSLLTRLESLTNGINGMIFTADDLDDKELFDDNVIVDLSSVGASETKALIMGILVMKLQQYRSASKKRNQDLKHITVLEEAHNLLKRTSTEQSMEGSNLIGKSVEMIANSIAEMRTYGEGFIIADQAPGLLDMSVIRNTNTKIIFRLPDYSDRELVGKSANLNDSQIDELAKLKKGVAAIYQNGWISPVLCQFDKYDKGAYYEKPDERWKFKDEDSEDVKNVLNLIMHSDIKNSIDDVDNDRIAKSKLPDWLKVDILECFADENAIDRGRKIAKIAYEFFDAEETLETVSCVKDIAEWQDELRDKLKPSINDFTDYEIEHLLALLVHEHYLIHHDYEPIYLSYMEHMGRKYNY